jgi:hypothetical protein
MPLVAPLVVRASGPEADALRAAVHADADGTCELTRAAIADDGAVEADHAVEVAMLGAIAAHVFRKQPAHLQASAGTLLTSLVNARANLRSLSRDAHRLKSTMMKRLLVKLKEALRRGSAITTMSAATATADPGLDATALRTVAHDHRALAAAIDEFALGDPSERELHYVADVLRALVADEFSLLWTRSGAPTVVETHTTKADD